MTIFQFKRSCRFLRMKSNRLGIHVATFLHGSDKVNGLPAPGEWEKTVCGSTYKLRQGVINNHMEL